jgi:hypothetical protein
MPIDERDDDGPTTISDGARCEGGGGGGATMEPSRRTGGNDNDDEEEDSSRASDEIAAVASNMALINIVFWEIFLYLLVGQTSGSL